MQHTMTTFVIAIAAISRLSSIQDPRPAPRAPVPAPDKSVTYTGCLVAGTKPGTFVLNDADEVLPTIKPPVNPAAPPAAGVPEVPTPISEAKGQALKIQGTPLGFDLAANVNHRVQVTGTVAEAPGSQSETPPPDLPPGKSDVLLKTITIQNAKSLADQCGLGA